MDSNRVIPDILWLTWKVKEIPTSLKKEVNSWKKSNPQLDIRIMDDKECSNLILEHFGSYVHSLYIALPQPIMRADFWRLAVVYVHGGYYSDLDITCNKNIKNFIGNVDAVFMREINNISNYFFGAAPKHPAIKMAIDSMITEMKVIINKDTQSFGMHGLHAAVRNYYKIVGTSYTSSDTVQFLLDSSVREKNILIHRGASSENISDYESWRARVDTMNKERKESKDILFVTTFNKNGYDLYGKTWLSTFIKTANYYTKFRAKIYYEGFQPDVEHPLVEWINYEDTIIHHPEWKKDYNKRTTHADYVKTMTIRFSHKAFVIMHALENNSNDYIIWLDGDCIFKDSDYTSWPTNLMNNKFLACQVEQNHDLNHVESGILIFDGKHSKKQVFVDAFRNWYKVDNILKMGQPYDGFLVFKTLLSTGLDYTDLNKGIGGGIQSDPSKTFLHPQISSKFIHNIGWTGKNQYASWNTVFERDDIYKKMESVLFSNSKNSDIFKMSVKALNKLEKLKRFK